METIAVEEVKEIRSFAELRKRACEIGPKRVGVVLADDEVALTAASDALCSGIANPVLIGDKGKIRSRAKSLGFLELIEKAEFVWREMRMLQRQQCRWRAREA